jgi:hypothetical protein
MSENDNNFDALRRLLALKRHEIPPPGYFEDFSGSVIGRIRASEAAQPLPWLFRFFQAFESKPAYPVALASSLCVLLLFGIVNVEQNPEITPVWGSSTFGSVADVNSGGAAADSLLAMVDTNSPSDPASTSSLFNTQPNPLLKQISYSGGN